MKAGQVFINLCFVLSILETWKKPLKWEWIGLLEKVKKVRSVVLLYFYFGEHDYSLADILGIIFV